MTAARSASKEDIENVVAWAELVDDILCYVPHEKRAEVLALVSEHQGEQRKKLEAAGGGFIITTIKDIEEWSKTPGALARNAIKRLKGLIIQVLVRDITNDSSSKDAAAILFAYQEHGSGSRLLLDYIGDLPGIAKKSSARKRGTGVEKSQEQK
jgi:hypothetical protein